MKHPQPADSPAPSLYLRGGGGVQRLGPTLQPRGDGSLAPPLQESIFSLIEEFSDLSIAALGGEEIVDTLPVSSIDQVTKCDSSVVLSIKSAIRLVASRRSHRASSSHAI